MKYTVYDRLLKREIGYERKRYSDIRGIYGDRQWIDRMDIVNELEGHNGCVNALCWSTSGRLLASGSDDHRINIHSYHPESSTSQFNLTTSILTGHHHNIFSVKFMPYSNDRTIVSATDDVRIFDIEHSGHSAFGSSSNRSRPPPQRIGHYGVRDGVTLTEGDTNAKAFRCHSDIVKRIVTEDNPFYFLTCSEDGDVRQWDIRQPSKTYPPPRDSMVPSWASNPEASDNIPPPLISYKRYRLDLNTVSCSPSQPHYIALGGAHLHCFLHDRRMLGRDKYHERGAKLASPSNWSDTADEELGKATQCVKKFAPNGKKRMRGPDNGHITACKISDANPNDLIVSWSQDWIYSFDILRSPDATEEVKTSKVSTSNSGRRVKDKSRKRKRPRSTGLSQEGLDRAGSRQRTQSAQASVEDLPEGEELALRVNYGNGQSEEIRIEPPESPLSEDQTAVLEQTDHYRIAMTTTKILLSVFDSEGAAAGASATNGYTSVLGLAASILPEMDDLSRYWGYPVNPNPVDVIVQKKLREGRAASRRFVQAAGTLARVLGGRLHTGGNADAVISRYFTSIQPAPSEPELPRHEQFGYDFLKAILLWLDSGLGAVVEGFSSASPSSRLPIPSGADVDAIGDILIPHLLRLAGDTPIVDVDVSKFENDETRILFPSERDAVIAFSDTLKVPFADLTGDSAPSSGDTSVEVDVQDRRAAITRWALKVGRGVLLNASKDVRFTTVDRAFGGSGASDPHLKSQEEALRARQEDVDPLEEDEPIANAELVSRPWTEHAEEQTGESSSRPTAAESDRRRSSGPSFPIEVEEEDKDAGEDEDDSDGDLNSSEDDSDDDSDDLDDEGLSRTRSGRILWRSDFDRNIRERVELDVPCAPHTRVYQGHCNVKTVKDVNFFGLQDEYVVSGSDSGHVFIWDKKTSQLVNILEGDGEVVNVVQGHPYEPTMAVSGIDHTIKIFSPDAHEQYNARKGIGVHSADPGLSSLSFGRRRRAPIPTEPDDEPNDDESGSAHSEDDESDVEVARNGLGSRKRMHQQYQITSQNDMERRGGREDVFLTRALFTEIAARIRAHHEGGGGDDDDEPVFVNANDEPCSVM
ncbi:WD40 repeat-like protein [Corynespora cassiicola Philippines]|uniref:WD40 repeat-like protein n=1 Tax=Corynespora cassiicola Philippines TaxID=1448308 RepID=A0A2T2NCV4_CORCC|nr:WD40 repeat-like protein [Corynespora cassiicola Philippines]